MEQSTENQMTTRTPEQIAEEKAKVIEIQSRAMAEDRIYLTQSYITPFILQAINEATEGKDREIGDIVKQRLNFQLSKIATTLNEIGIPGGSVDEQLSHIRETLVKTRLENTQLREENDGLKAALSSGLCSKHRTPDPLNCDICNTVKCLSGAIDQWREENERLKAVGHHMESCRALLNVPSDEVLYQSISQLKQEVERLNEGRAVLKQHIEQLDGQLSGERNDKNQLKQRVEELEKALASGLCPEHQIPEPESCSLCGWLSCLQDGDNSKLSTAEARIAEFEAHKKFQEDRGIKTESAKWLDARCYGGCQSLIFEARVKELEERLANQRRDLSAAHDDTLAGLAKTRAEAKQLIEELNRRIDNQMTHIEAFAGCLDGLLPSGGARIPGSGMDSYRAAEDIRRVAQHYIHENKHLTAKLDEARKGLKEIVEWGADPHIAELASQTLGRIGEGNKLP